MLAAKRAQVLLELLHIVLETGVAPVVVDADSGEADAAPANLEDAVDVRQIVDQSLNSQFLRDLLAQRRRVARIVVICEPVTKLVQQVGANAVRVGNIDAARGARLPVLADGGQVAGILAAVARGDLDHPVIWFL